MPTGRKPIIGAILIAVFITACLGWLAHSMGVSVPWWSYPPVFALFALGLYGIAGLLLRGGNKREANSAFGISIEE